MSEPKDTVINAQGSQGFINQPSGPITQNFNTQRQRTCPTPPPAPDHFGGRDTELTQFKTLLKTGQITAITAVQGLGGIGKTYLARQLAHDLFQDKTFRAVLWADVNRQPDPLNLLLNWAYYDDPKFTPPKNQTLPQLALHVKALLESLIVEKCEQGQPARTLVVLDDVWDNGKETVRLLRMACPADATVLLTSRSEELAIALKARVQMLERVQGEAAIQLLQTYLPDAEPAALLELAEVLGGHPLALALAARRVQRKSNKVKALRDQITLYRKGLPEGSDFLGLELEQGEGREDNLRVALSYSYADLSGEDQARFRALGVLAYDQPFDNVLLSALWQVEAGQVEDHCDTLRLLSLLEVVSSEDNEGWYKLHPLLQAYARALLLQNADEYGEVLRRYQGRVIELAAPFNKLPPEEWGQLNPYLPHFLAVGDGLVEQTATIETLEDESLIRLAQSFALSTHSYLGMRREVRRDKWLEMGLATSRRLQDQLCEALFLNELAALYRFIGELDKALDYYQQALALRKALGDSSVEAITLNNLGMVCFQRGELDKALDYYQQALALRKALDDSGVEAITLNNLGEVYRSKQEHEKALDYYQQALALRKALDDSGGKANTLNNLGEIYRSKQEHEKALDYYQQALVLYRAAGDSGGEANTLNNLGVLLWQMNQQQEGLAMVEQALVLFTAVRSPKADSVRVNLRQMKAALGL